MPSLKNVLFKLGSHAEAKFDKLKSDTFERLGRDKPVEVLPYFGFGNQTQAWIKGRALETKNIKVGTDQDSVWENLLNMYRRFESDELPHTPVQLKFLDQSRDLLTDEEGFFDATFKYDKLNEHGWLPVAASLLNYPNVGQAEAQIFVPPPSAKFGVISDIDDTIIQTNATKLLEMAQNTFLKNASTRTPFEGVAEFYQALQADGSDPQVNPLFYVSNGPWNLFDFLRDFMELKNIPLEPIFLRDFGLTADHLIANKQHKDQIIRHLLSVYPNLPFVLIGDSGEHDPQIYQVIANTFPHRIKAIYIRDVDKTKRAKVQKIAKEVTELGVPMITVAHTEEAMTHARSLGLVG